MINRKIPTVEEILKRITSYDALMMPHYLNQIEMEECYDNKIGFVYRMAKRNNKKFLIREPSKLSISEYWFHTYVDRKLVEFGHEEYRVKVSPKFGKNANFFRDKELLEDIVTNMALNDTNRAIIEEIFSRMVFGQSYGFVDIKEGKPVIRRINMCDAFFDIGAAIPTKEDARWCAIREYTQNLEGDSASPELKQYIRYFWKENDKVLFLVLNEKTKELTPINENGEFVGEYPSKILPLVFFGFVVSKTNSLFSISLARRGTFGGQGILGSLQDWGYFNGYRYDAISTPLKRVFDLDCELNTLKERLMIQGLSMTNTANVFVGLDSVAAKAITDAAESGGIACVMPPYNAQGELSPALAAIAAPKPTDPQMFSVGGIGVSESLLALMEQVRRAIQLAAGVTGSNMNTGATNQSGYAIEQQSYQVNAGSRQLSHVMRRSLDRLCAILVDVSLNLAVLKGESLYSDVIEQGDRIAAPELLALMNKYSITIKAVPSTDLENRNMRAQIAEGLQIANADPRYAPIIAEYMPPDVRDKMMNIFETQIDSGLLEVMDGKRSPAEYRKQIEENKQPSLEERQMNILQKDSETNSYFVQKQAEKEEERLNIEREKIAKDYEVKMKKITEDTETKLEAMRMQLEIALAKQE